MSVALHSIDAVVQRTGLSAHVIRVWEKRYRAVQPARTATNRRQYSDEEIERLTLLRDLTREGQSIGYVAKLPTEQLRQLVTGPGASLLDTPRARGDGFTLIDSSASSLDAALVAVRSMDARALDGALKRAAVALGTQGMLQRVAAPLAQTLGELWREGGITSAHEHFATAVLRTHLAQTTAAFAPSGTEPVLIVATPSGQLHEIGALLVSGVAANLAWRVVYLGASLPAVEITGAAIQSRAKAVALSLVFPDDDAGLESELTRLRELLPPAVSLVVGGRATPAYRRVLERIGAFQVSDLQAFGALLDQLRRSGPQPEVRPSE
jgi:DNA-binding transcriptional MerR regulator/methylmalonyl-CoA mutase cobalamin-binding subunit